MRRFFRARGEARSLALLFLFTGLAPFSCVRSSDDDVFKSAGCTLGEEACGCRADKSCNAPLSCLSDLCVNPTGSGGSSTSGGSAGSSGGSAGASDSGEGGKNDGASSGGMAGAGDSGGFSSGGDPGTGGGSSFGNLVENGDFADGEMLWSFEPAQATRSIEDGALCITLAAGESVALGWPSNASRAFTLESGQSYTLSYRASSTGPLEISATAKIGHAVSPYTTHFEESFSVNTNLKSYSHDFDVVDADDGAGLVFSLTGAQGDGTTTVCFDDVSVLESP